MGCRSVEDIHFRRLFLLEFILSPYRTLQPTIVYVLQNIRQLPSSYANNPKQGSTVSSHWRSYCDRLKCYGALAIAG